MSNFVNGEVRISEPASLVSIALGGVFGESGGKPVSLSLIHISEPTRH